MATHAPALDVARRQLVENWERETATTLRVLRAYPEDRADLKPHERSKSARELAWLFTLEQVMAAAAVRGEMKLGGGMPPAPSTLTEVVDAFEASREELLALLRDCPDDQLEGTTRFFTAPKTMGDWPNVEFLWFLLHDQIHHRGQFSVYLRMADGRVPSIYGPSADEPWT